jgi:hypothetical protein
MSLAEGANVAVYVRDSYDYFLNDRYRLQDYISNTNATVLALDAMSPSARTPAQNNMWTHACQASLKHKTLKSR